MKPRILLPCLRGFGFEFSDAFEKELLDDAESDAVFRLIDALYNGPQESDLILRTGVTGIAELSPVTRARFQTR